MTVSPTKIAEPRKMLFGMWTWVDPRNCILDGVQILLQKGHLEYALPIGQPTVSRYWKHKWKMKDELETVDKWSKNSDDRPHCRGRFFIKKILCDIWLLLLANQNAGQQHSGKSQHQGYWEWCSAMCRKIRSHPPQECPFCSRIWTPSNMQFLESTRVHIPNSILLGSPIFVEY